MISPRIGEDQLGFEGYKFKHKLVVLQKLRDAQDPAASHAKNYEIVLYLSPVEKKFFRFDQMEIIFTVALAPYREKILTEIPPFDEVEPTLEAVGNVFYQILKEAFAENSAKLERLEISESPIRTAIINDVSTDKKILLGGKKVKLTNLVLGNVISQSTSDIISEHGEEETSTVEIMHAPEPVQEAAAPKSIKAPEIVCTPKVIAPENSPIIEEQKKATWYQFVIALLCLSAVGVGLAFFLGSMGLYPTGEDIFGHLFKSDLLYQSISNGDFYPLYTDPWYNGMQPFRYWAPLPYYLLAALQFFAGGEVLTSYLVFVAFSVIFGGMGWLLWGMTYQRMVFCTFLGTLWFFFPDNLRVFFVEGNYPRMVVAMFLPYIFFFIWRYVEYRKKSAIIPLVLTMTCIILCHVMIAAMIGIATFLFLSLYSISEKRAKESFQVILTMLLCFALCGIWLYPALQGGLMGMDASGTSEVMQSLSTPLSISLNPLLRVQGGFELFYFGLSVVAITIMGLFLGKKKSRAAFYTVLIVFLGTTTTMVTFLEKLPLNELLWMRRFTPIVYALFLLAILEWKTSKRYILLMFALVLVFDCVPSLDFKSYHSQTSSVLVYSIEDAKEITKQRLSLLDVSTFGSYPSFEIAAQKEKTPYTFGWAWQGATTADNIVMLNGAAEKGYYHYVFDRSLELGDDTVMVHKKLVAKAKKTFVSLTEGAKASGYSLQKETNEVYLFHRDTPKTFGVITEYIGLTIGKSATAITMSYPYFEEGESENLTDYTFEELSRYKIIYLSGFTYKDRTLAEDLLLRLSKEGVKVVIDMNRIPVDPLTTRMSFFDVTAQSITFSERYPELMYENKVYNALPFTEDYSTWNTVYLENAEHVLGYSWFKSKKLAFVGYSNNRNLIFTGYNFLFHAMESGDESITALLSEMIEIEPDQLPQRKIVPLTIRYEKDKIVILSPGGNVNTTLAYQDNFRSEQKIENRNNLLVVTEPYTEIKIVYPYLFEGLALSGLGLLGIAIILYFIYRKRGVPIEEKIC